MTEFEQYKKKTFQEKDLKEAKLPKRAIKNLLEKRKRWGIQQILNTSRLSRACKIPLLIRLFSPNERRDFSYAVLRRMGYNKPRRTYIKELLGPAWADAVNSRSIYQPKPSYEECEAYASFTAAQQIFTLPFLDPNYKNEDYMEILDKYLRKFGYLRYTHKVTLV